MEEVDGVEVEPAGRAGAPTGMARGREEQGEGKDCP